MSAFSKFQVWLFLSSLAAFASDGLDLTRYQSGLEISGQGYSATDLDRNIGKYSSADEGISFAIPVHHAILRSNDDFSYHQFLLNGSVSAEEPQISFLNKPHDLYKANVGFTMLSATSGENLYMLSVAGGIEEDQTTLQQYSLAFKFFGLGTWRTSESFMFLYGLDYGSLLGRGRFLPVAGFQWGMVENAGLIVLIPAYVRFTAHVSKRWTFAPLLYLACDSSMLSNDSDFLGQQPHLVYRFTQYKSGLQAVYKIAKSWTATMEGGYAFARRLSLSTDFGDIFSQAVGSGVYAQVSLKVRLGESWEEKLGTLKRGFTLH